MKVVRKDIFMDRRQTETEEFFYSLALIAGAHGANCCCCCCCSSDGLRCSYTNDEQISLQA